MSRRKRYFNQAAATWDAHFFTPTLDAFLTKLVPSFQLKPGDHVLDVGSGTGRLIPYVLQAIGSTGSITAIDYAENMVEICQSKYGHLSNVTILFQDIEAIIQVTSSFDTVLCFGLFPHLEHPDHVVANLYRVLKPNGQLIIAHALSSVEIRNHHHNTVEAVASDVLPNDVEMRRLLHHAGFIEISIIDEPGQYLCRAIKPGGESDG